MFLYFSQPEELVKCLQELENSASRDAVVREKIAALPQEVSDIKKLDDLTGISKYICRAEPLPKISDRASATVNLNDTRV